MNKPAPPLGGSAGSAGKERSKLFNNLPAPTAQADHHNRIPPLTWSGDLADTLMDRIAMPRAQARAGAVRPHDVGSD